MASESSELVFRVPANITTACDQQVYKGYVMNLSADEAFVMLPASVDLAAEVRLRFSIHGNNCEGIGRVTEVMQFGVGNGFTVDLTRVNHAYAEFVADMRLAGAEQLISFVRSMGRIEVQIGSTLVERAPAMNWSGINSLPN